MSTIKNQSQASRNQNPLSLWQRDVNNLFKRFGRALSPLTDEEIEFAPNVELSEKEKSYTLRAEVAGIPEKNITVTLSDNNLILEGERRSEREEKEEGFFSSEFSYGEFYRAIPLKEEVDPDSVKASYKDGILTVRLEKMNPTSQQSKRIPIVKS